MITAETNRLAQSRGVVRPRIKSHINFLRHELGASCQSLAASTGSRSLRLSV
jgi:hypothetical protein